MIKKWMLLVCFLPNVLLAELAGNNEPANCVTETLCDSTLQEQPAGVIEQTILPAPDKTPDTQDDKDKPYDWKKRGFFQALFHAGVNFAQIDGDAYSGYNKAGFDVGAGVLVRFHKYFSTSVEVGYTMWGAQANLIEKNTDLYRTNLNYVQIPIAINVHEKEIFLFSAGLNVSFLAQFKERNEIGINTTDTVQPQPKRFDLDAFASIHFIIKKQFGIGLKFSYSMIPFRGIEPVYASLTHIHNEYNNVLTIRFMYILSAWKKK